MPVIAIDAHLIETLISAATVDEMVDRLTAVDLLHEAGLNQLLAEGVNMTRSNPDHARRLAAVCAAVAPLVNAPGVIPRAAYIRAQSHALSGELQTALQLIDEAWEGYDRLKMELPALRTNVGKMHVLNELGRHQEALDAGLTALDRIHNAPPDAAEFHTPEARLIVTLTQMNRGICYRRMGQYERALAAYEAAEQECLTADMPQHLGDIRNNVGVTLMYLGRVTEALAAFEAAASAYVAANHTRLYAFCLNNIGEARLLLGNYRASLETLQLARQQFEQLQIPVDEYLLLLEGHVYLALNLYPEAAAAYGEAESRCQAAGMTHFQARALWGLGAAYAAQNQFEPAETALREAARLFAAAGNAPLHASVLLEQAALQMAQGANGLARENATQAAELLAEQAYPVEQTYVHLRLADLVGEDLTAADKHLLAAERLSESLPLPHLHYRVQQRLGQLRRQQGRPDEARRRLETAVAAIERLRGGVAQEAMRVSFLYDKTAAYEELLQLHLDAGEVDDAFVVAEQAKSRALVDLLAGVSQPPPAAPDDQASQLEQLRADLNAVYGEFLGGKRNHEPAADPLELEARARKLEREISRLRLQAAVATPADLFAAPLPLAEIAAQLPQEAALVAYHISGDELLAFVHAQGRMTAVRHLTSAAAASQLLQRLTAQWDRFRPGDNFVQRHIGQLERSAQRILGELYQALIAPIAHLLPAAADGGPPPQLAIVPHGLLHQIPFHALHDGERYLLERFEISYAPSATALVLCQRREMAQSARAVIAGVADPSIPQVERELAVVAEQVRRRWPETAVYQNEAATREAVAEASQGAGLLHLACHGLFRADNPMFSALKLSDSWLTAVDVLQFDLSGALAVLSACESGRSRVINGDELLGLTRAFLGAGAASLLVSLWLAHDETTASLMGDWYAQLNQQDAARPAGAARPAAALRAAQLGLKERYPHPYYWAPFIIIGKN